MFSAAIYIAYRRLGKVFTDSGCSVCSSEFAISYMDHFMDS